MRKTIAAKIRYLEQQFRNASYCLNNTRAGLSNPGYIEAYISKTYSHYSMLEPIMVDRPNIRPLCTEDSVVDASEENFRVTPPSMEQPVRSKIASLKSEDGDEAQFTSPKASTPTNTKHYRPSIVTQEVSRTSSVRKRIKRGLEIPSILENSALISIRREDLALKNSQKESNEAIKKATTA